MKKPPSETGSNVSSGYGPVPRGLGYKSPYTRDSMAPDNIDDPLIRSVPINTPVIQHAINTAQQADLRSQQSFDISGQAAGHVGAHVAAASQQFGVQVAAIAALGSVVNDTIEWSMTLSIANPMQKFV